MVLNHILWYLHHAGSFTWTDQDADVSRVFKNYKFVITTPSTKSHWITINTKLHVCTLWIATSTSDNKCDTSVMSLSAPLPLSLSRSHTHSLCIYYNMRVYVLVTTSRWLFMHKGICLHFINCFWIISVNVLPVRGFYRRNEQFIHQ